MEPESEVKTLANTTVSVKSPLLNEMDVFR